MRRNRLEFIRKLRVRMLRLAFLPIIVVALFGWRSWEDGSALSLIVQSAGYTLLTAGLTLRLWATMYIGSRKSRELTCEGPYSVCRNPLYVGTVLVAGGTSLCLENVLIFAVTLLLTVPVHVAVAVAEERRLAQLFGAEFEEYTRHVPRFLFRFSNYHSSEWLSVSAPAIRRGLVEASAVLMLPFLGNLLSLLHARGLLPVLLSLFWRKT